MVGRGGPAVRRRAAEHPDLHLVVVVPRVPDQDGAFAQRPQLIGRWQAIEMCRKAGQDRVHVFDVENHAGTPVYVHAKVCVVDDVWVSVGSDNFNRRSWTHDSELSSGVLDTTRDPREPRDPAGTGDGARTFARDLRLTLAREHLDLPDDGSRDDELLDPERFVRRSSTARAARSTPGTRAAGRGPAPRAGSARTRPRSCRCSPGSGRPRSTACSTTPTAAPLRLRLKKTF